MANLSPLLAFLFVGVAFGSNCQKKSFGQPSFVCVANEGHNDELPVIGKSGRGEVQIFETDKGNKRFEKRTQRFNDNRDIHGDQWTIKIDKNKKYQEIMGFGGAMSDAAVINIHKMSPKLQRQILSDYYSDKGAEYSFTRTTIAGSDFSNRAYTYADTPDDWDLKHFALVDEDLNMRIPFIKLADEVAAHKPVKNFGSPWSGPAWLKDSKRLNHRGQLIGIPNSREAHTYANYLLRYFQEYRKHGVEFWGMTVQNEPATGWEEWFPWNTMGYSPEMERDFLKVDLGPLLEKNGWTPNNFTFMILDHNRDMLPWWYPATMNDPEASRFAKGIADHWYGNGAPVTNFDDFHRAHPDKFILATEACCGGPHLGQWDCAENYAHDILRDLTHWVVGWVDWNLALDTKGGPNWANNFVDAPILVNPEAKEYYKQPTYYVLAHFGKLIPPSSHRIGTDPEYIDSDSKGHQGVQVGAFQRPDGGIAVIAVNAKDSAQAFTIQDPELGTLKLQAEPHSINSYLYYY